LLRYLLFHSSLACEYHESLSTPAHLDLVSDFSEGKAAYSKLPSGQSLFFGSYDARALPVAASLVRPAASLRSLRQADHKSYKAR
jgi:hypothetical protein